MVLATVRWLLFVGYVFLLCTAPFALLWGPIGFAIGAVATLSLLGVLRHKADRQIAMRLGVRPLSKAEAPHVHAITKELARRLRIPVPRLGVIDTPSLNLAVFGFGTGGYHLALTAGSLQDLGRTELTALIGRQLCWLRTGNVPGESWLSQYFALFDWMARSSDRMAQGRRFYEFPTFLRKVLFYPLTLYPSFVLSGHREGPALDLRSLRITRNVRALSEGLRRLEAMSERLPLSPDFSTRHLFLYHPAATDGLARVFFGEENFGRRIQAVEALTQVSLPAAAEVG